MTEHDEQDTITQIDFGCECDLHHFHPRDTDIVVREFIRQAKEKGLSRIRLVHGKGRSEKKGRVLKLLAEHPDVASYGNDGTNWGATLIILKL